MAELGEGRTGCSGPRRDYMRTYDGDRGADARPARCRDRHLDLRRHPQSASASGDERRHLLLLRRRGDGTPTLEILAHQASQSLEKPALSLVERRAGAIIDDAECPEPVTAIGAQQGRSGVEADPGFRQGLSLKRGSACVLGTTRVSPPRMVWAQ